MTPQTINATDEAAALADQHGIDLEHVTGSGQDGRIRVSDVREHVGEPAAAAASGWPSKGYSGPQPYEGEEAQVITHSRPILSSGSAGGDVAELCRLLKAVGIETPTSEGANPFCILGPGEAAAIDRFRADYGVREDASAFGGDEQLAARHVGPWTWEALYRAADAS